VKTEELFALVDGSLPKHSIKRPGAQATRKHSEPAEVECTNGHEFLLDGDQKVSGVLAVRKCSSEGFAKNITKSQAVVRKLSALVNRHLEKNGVKEEQKAQFIKATGNKTHTFFHYSFDAKKEHHEHIKSALRDACRDKEVRIFGYINVFDRTLLNK
jgi:hypothetical protein